MQKLHFPFLRTMKPHHHFTPSPTTVTSSLPGVLLDNLNTSNEVLAVINSVSPIEPSLRKLSPFLNREVVTRVLQSQAAAHLNQDPRICFRFYIWASKRSRFRHGVSLNLIVDMLVGSGDEGLFDLYWGVLDELRREKMRVSAHAFVVLILGYWRLRKAEKAVETFGLMRDYECKPNLAVFNVILNVLVKKDLILLALSVYNMMLKSNFRMGCDTFNVLIDGLCKNGMTKNALVLFGEMTERGILPNTITYTVVISGLCKTKRLHDAHRLFNSMKSSGCYPNSATYNALLDGFCKCDQIDDAFMLFESSKKEGYNVGIQGYSNLLHGFIRAKRLREAEALFKQVSDVGLVPDLILYSIMMQGLSEEGRMEDAMDMFRDMIEKGVEPDTRCYNVLIKGFYDVGLLDQAQSLKIEMSQCGHIPDTFTHTILICGLCRNGMLDEAQQIFNDMEKLGCSPTVVTFNAVIDGLCKAGKLEEAHLLLYKMEIGKNPSLFLRLSQGTDRVLDSASLQKMVENLVDSGLIYKAYKLLMQLVGSGVVPDITTYNTLINGMCRAGKVNIALKLFEELQLKGHIPDSVTYATLIQGFQSVDREGDAHKLLEQMSENGCKPTPSVYKTLMTWSCRRRKSKVAFELWLKYMRDIGGVEDESLKLAEEYFEKGDVDIAVRRLLEMDKKLADFDSAFYSIWLIGLCQANRMDEAMKTFFILEEFDVGLSASSCAKLIQALCAEGNLGNAVDIFLYTMEKGYRLMPRICNRLLQVLLNSKDKAVVAFELLDRMKSTGYDLNSYIRHSTRVLLKHHYSVREMENVSAG